MNQEQRERVSSMNKPLAHRLYAALVMGPHNVEKVARRLGCQTRTIYNWAENVAILPAWALAPLYLATKDIKLFADLSGASDLGLVVSEAGEVAPSPDAILLQGLGLGHLTGKLMGLLQQHLADGVYTEQEAREACEAIDTIASALASLKNRINRAVR